MTAEIREQRLQDRVPYYRNVILRMIRTFEGLFEKNLPLHGTLSKYLFSKEGYKPIANILQKKLKEKYFHLTTRDGECYIVITKSIPYSSLTEEVLASFMEYTRAENAKLHAPIVAATLEMLPIQKEITFHEELPDYTPWETGSRIVVSSKAEEDEYFLNALNNIYKRGSHRIIIVK